ncbi:MAG: ArnT family glycosyltransferase [Acidobacteriota bacterium]
MTSMALSALQVAITAFAAWTLGRWTLGRFVTFSHPALRIAACMTTGFLIWSHLTFGLAVAGFVSRQAAAGLLTLASALAVAEMIRLRRAPAWRRVWPALKRPSAPAFTVALLAVLYIAFLLAVAALPPTGVDEMLYHLEVPRQFLESGHQPFFRDNNQAYFPHFGEMLFLNGLSLGGETAARLFHTLFALILGLAVYGFAREALTASHSLLAAAVLLTVPSLIVVAASAYVDLMFSSFAFLALVALVKFLESGETVWVVVAGIMAGGACSTKYTGIQLVLLLVLILLIQQLRGAVTGWKFGALLLPTLAFLIASPYYVRNLALTGWPLFPFHIPGFTLSPEVNWDENRARLYLRWLSGYGIGYQVTLGDKLLAPLLVFIKARIGDPQAYDGFLGPVFLAVPPLLLMTRGLIRQWGILILFAGLFIGYWTVTTPQARFLLPVLPVLAVLLAHGIAGLRSRPLALIVILLTALNLAVGIRAVARLDPFGYWSGQESRDSYLTRNVRGYPVLEQLNRIVGPGESVYMVAGYNYGYYLDCAWRADFTFTDYRFALVLERARTPGDILSFLQSQDATHLLLNQAVLNHPDAGLPDKELGKLREFLARHAREVYRYGEFALFAIQP